MPDGCVVAQDGLEVHLVGLPVDTAIRENAAAENRVGLVRLVIESPAERMDLVAPVRAYERDIAILLRGHDEGKVRRTVRLPQRQPWRHRKTVPIGGPRATSSRWPR